MCDCGEEEIWKVIDGYEYQVSSCGRVRNEMGQMVPSKTTEKGTHVRLPKKVMRLARVVATAFLPNPESMAYVNRRDSNRENNHASNLFWSLRPGGRKTSNIHRRKPVEQWTRDGKFVETWESPQKVAESFSSKVQQVRDCCNGKFKTFAGFVWKWGNDPDLEGEIWKDYSGENKNVLKVSNKGRLLLRGDIKTFGNKSVGGYMKYSTLSVHRLVAEAFCGELTDDLVVNHRNSQPSDNRAENLEICTHSWNSRHSFLSEEEKESMEVVDLEGEVWKSIPHAKNYRVSNKGRVSSPENFLLRKSELYGNVIVCIKGKMTPVKKLVAAAFVEKENFGGVIHCIDGDPHNLHVENLQLCSKGKEIGRKKRVLATDKIIQMSTSGKILREFETKEAAVAETQGISCCGLGRAMASGKKYGGFLWCYESSFNLEGEEWKTISCGDKKVTVSSLGRALGKAGRKTYGSLCANGHMYHKTMKVHRLVAAAFLPEPLKGQTSVMHINGKKDDNRVSNLAWASMTTICRNKKSISREGYRNKKDHNAASNLEWVTPSRNIRHAHESGLISLPDRS